MREREKSHDNVLKVSLGDLRCLAFLVWEMGQKRPRKSGVGAVVDVQHVEAGYAPVLVVVLDTARLVFASLVVVAAVPVVLDAAVPSVVADVTVAGVPLVPVVVSLVAEDVS